MSKESLVIIIACVIAMIVLPELLFLLGLLIMAIVVIEIGRKMANALGGLIAVGSIFLMIAVVVGAILEAFKGGS